MSFDLAFNLGIHNFINGQPWDYIFIFITKLGDGFLWILLTVLFLIFKKTRYLGVALFLGLAFAYTFSEIIKFMVNRPRPYMEYPYQLIFREPGGTSFPSAHSATSFAAATVIFILARERFERIARWFVLVLAALIAFSRLYLFVHYPSDVAVGILLGIASGYLATRVSYWLLERDYLSFLNLPPYTRKLYGPNTFKVR